MTELEKQIAELKEEIRLWQESYDSHQDGCNTMALRDLNKALKIIESLQAELSAANESLTIAYLSGSASKDGDVRKLEAENQELKLHAAGVYLNDQIKLGNLEAENQELESKLEEAIKALTTIQNISHEGFGCGSQVTYQQAAQAHEKALEALYKIMCGEKHDR